MDYVSKSVVMLRDIHQTVTMEIMSMVMDVAETAILKLDIHVTVGLQTLLTLVVQPCLQLFHFRKEANPIFMERSC